MRCDMKTIVYKIKGLSSVHNPVSGRVEQKEVLAGVRTEYTEENLKIAKSEAYNGEVDVIEEE